MEWFLTDLDVSCPFVFLSALGNISGTIVKSSSCPLYILSMEARVVFFGTTLKSVLLGESRPDSRPESQPVRESAARLCTCRRFERFFRRLGVGLNWVWGGSVRKTGVCIFNFNELIHLFSLSLRNAKYHSFNFIVLLEKIYKCLV